MSDMIGGLWNKKMGIVNEYSNIQVVAPIFKFEDDNTNYSQYTCSNELYEKIEENCNKFNIKKNIKFNTKVLDFKSIDNNNVEITLLDLINNTISVVKSNALYIRTGTLNKVRPLIFKNEDKFKGIIDYGTNSGKDNIEFKDKFLSLFKPSYLGFNFFAICAFLTSSSRS